METSNPASPVNAVLSAILRPEVLRITAIVLGIFAVLFLGLSTGGAYMGGQEARASVHMGWGGQANVMALAMTGALVRVMILCTLTMTAGVVLAFFRRLVPAAACLFGAALAWHWLLGGWLRATEAGGLLWLLLPAYLAGIAAFGAHYLTLHPFAVSAPEPKPET